MDQRTFDSLTRSLAATRTRRGFLGALAALGAGLLGARAGGAQTTQAQCGNVACFNRITNAVDVACAPGCVCCVYGNGNSRCRPPQECAGTPTCPPGQVLGPSGTCAAPTTTTTTTAAPTTTSTTTTAAPTTTSTTTTAAPTTTTAAPTTTTTTTTAAPTTTTTTSTTTTTTAAPTTTTTTTAPPVVLVFRCRCLDTTLQEVCRAAPCTPDSLTAICQELCAGHNGPGGGDLSCGGGACPP